jgi:hypothetical protein
VKLEANERFVLNCGLTHKFVATRSVSGTVNLQVYELV